MKRINTFLKKALIFSLIFVLSCPINTFATDDPTNSFFENSSVVTNQKEENSPTKDMLKDSAIITEQKKEEENNKKSFKDLDIDGLIEKFTSVNDSLVKISDTTEALSSYLYAIKEKGSEVPERLKNLKISADTAVFLDNDGNAFVGSPSEVFKMAKEQGMELDGKEFEDDNNAADTLDAMTFGIRMGGDAAMIFMMKATVYNILRVNTTELQNVVKYFDFTIPLGLTLCLLYALLELANKSHRDLQSIETFTWWLIKLAIGFLFVSCSKAFAELVYNLVNIFMDYFIADAGDSLETMGTKYNVWMKIALECDTTNIITGLINFVKELLVWVINTLLGTIVTLITAVMCYSFKLTLALRTMFIPLAIADVSSGGTAGPGMRYLKKTFGTAMQAGAICFMISIASEFQVDSSVMFAGFMVPFAVIGSIGTAKQIAEEALGG